MWEEIMHILKTCVCSDSFNLAKTGFWILNFLLALSRTFFVVVVVVLIIFTCSLQSLQLSIKAEEFKITKKGTSSYNQDAKFS